jgi:hypothetical protein
LYLSNGTADDATNVLTFPLDHESNASVTVIMHIAPTTTVVQKELLLTAQASDVKKAQPLTVNVLKVNVS